jgi:hypothetical protein
MYQDINELLVATPVHPFRIHLSDGAEQEVTHPDQVILTPFTLHVGIGQREGRAVDRVVRFAISHIARIEELHPN